MRFPRLFGPQALTIIASLTHLTTASFPDYTQIQSPNLDLNGLKRVALTGSFDSISSYQWVGQNEIQPSTNGSQSLFAQLPNGAFQTLAVADGAISAMCPFIRKDGTLFGVIVGGNFTSLAGTPAQGIALFNVSNNAVIPLPGLSGSVNVLWCDQATDSVYVGGDFKGAKSTNAIAWIGEAGWTNMPFQGFNAPVYTITQTASGNVVWGGAFSGLGNMSVATMSDPHDFQVVNLVTANVTGQATSSTDGFNDPKNVVCKASGQDGPGNTWLLQDQTPGHWQANFNFGFEPAKIRIWNTRQDGRGTKTWRFSNNPDQIKSILRLRYTDPVTKQEAECDQTCPLSNDPSVKFQDFYFVNGIVMNSFRIDISDWYGKGGGLDGVEIFQTAILSYAVSALNEPTCSVPTGGSTSTSTGPWVLTPSDNSVAQYLTARLEGPGINAGSAKVTFQPDVKQSGNYTVIVYTPGCKQDNNCERRGIANVTGLLSASGPPIATQIYQSNVYDKYDQIFTGFIDAVSGGFRPSVTIQPLDNQNSSIDLVALRVGFQLLDPTSIGLNGLYEYDPFNTTAQTNFKESKIDSIGVNLDVGAKVFTLQTVGQVVYGGGDFKGQSSSNFMVIDANNNSMTIPGNGLNGPVYTQTNVGNTVYIGGLFNATHSTTDIKGISNVATFDAGRMTWGSLGNGVDGSVSKVIPLTIKVDSDTPETCVTVNGLFKTVLAVDGHAAFAANGFAIWVPSKNSWLNNLGLQTKSIGGQIQATTNLTVEGVVNPLMSGTIVDQGLAIPYAASLTSLSGNATVSGCGLKIQSSSRSRIQKRDVVSNSSGISGVYAGLFDTMNGRNLSVYGGQFTAHASDGTNITNLAIIDDKGTVTGLAPGIDSNSTFTALTVSGDILYAGGSITGNIQNTPINGFVAWNLATSKYNSTLPPALGGDNVMVSAIAARPSSSDIYVAGHFQSAGGLGCPGVCVFSNGMWTRPGTGFAGNISKILWQGNDKLLVVGNLTVQNNQTSAATYDATAQTWSIPANAVNVPGPITALSPANGDGSSYWVAGQNTNNGSAFLMLYDGSNYQTAPPLGVGSTIKGLSVFTLTSAHDSNSFLDSSLSLLITGTLNLPPVGNVSGALFNGTGYTPFLLTNSNGGPGSLGVIVTEQNQNFNTRGGHLAVGFVILISLTISLALIFLLILIGLLIERRRRAAEGYRPAPQNYFEKTANMGRIPPERLFGNLNPGPTTPRV